MADKAGSAPRSGRSASTRLRIIVLAPLSKWTGTRKKRRCSVDVGRRRCAKHTCIGVTSLPVASRARRSATASANSARAGCSGLLPVSRTTRRRSVPLSSGTGRDAVAQHAAVAGQPLEPHAERRARTKRVLDEVERAARQRLGEVDAERRIPGRRWPPAATPLAPRVPAPARRDRRGRPAGQLRNRRRVAALAGDQHHEVGQHPSGDGETPSAGRSRASDRAWLASPHPNLENSGRDCQPRGRDGHVGSTGFLLQSDDECAGRRRRGGHQPASRSTGLRAGADHLLAPGTDVVSGRSHATRLGRTSAAPRRSRCVARARPHLVPQARSSDRRTRCTRSSAAAPPDAERAGEEAGKPVAARPRRPRFT